MDVRCERCHTEYELEDASVSSEGTDVQCTTCGHTFQVRRQLMAPTSLGFSATEVDSPPAPADWLLETADGQVHRFRDLTALQKWIIERKVTRLDRISKTGQAWRTLGEIVELLPFFDVVDEADRAKAAAAEVAGRGLRAQAADARRSGRAANEGRPTPAEAAGVDGPPPPPPPGVGQRPSGTRSSEIGPVEAPTPEAYIDTAVVRVRGGGRWKLLVSLAVAAGIAYVGITRLPQLLQYMPPGLARLAAPDPAPQTPAPPADPAPAPEGVAAANAPAAGTESVAGNTPAAASAPVNEATPTAPAGVAAAGTTPAPGAATAEAAPASGSAVAPAPAAPAAAPAKPAAAGRPAPGEPEAPPPYDELVATGDRMLENGRAVRAAKLYALALKQQPNGAEALAGMGYVNLDRQRADAAIAYFRRALAVAPYAPAMFGMGEAYRAVGDRARAADAYQRYLNTSPSGPDAPAARRQLKAMQAPGDPAPGGDTIPTPSTILQEGAAAEK